METFAGSKKLLHALSRVDSSSRCTAMRAGVFALAVIAVAAGAFAQPSAATLAEQSSIVVRARVMQLNASDEPLVPASGRTAVVTVQQMFAGSEIAGDQTGKLMTVILSRPEAVQSGEEALFFGNPRFLGKTVTIADEGELPQQAVAPNLQAVERAVQARHDAPLRSRLATADLVLRGKVESIRPLESPTAEREREKRGSGPGSEHDPEWQVATVRVATSLRGTQAGQNVTVIFAASRDITWYHAPKLKTGQDAVFILHAATKEEATLTRTPAMAQLIVKQPVYLVTEPSDVLTPQDEVRVRTLMANAKETK
jgi:hypothetical protein